jgi:hypothetical protein
MRGLRLRSRLALTVVGVMGTALILALAVGGPQRLAHPPARAAGEPQCGTDGDLGHYASAVVTLAPDSGFPGTPFQVDLSNVAVFQYEDQAAEVLWDWDPQSLEGELIGSGSIPKGKTSGSIDATVPEDAEADGHTVTACWWYKPKHTWYYEYATFKVKAPTPTPTGTPPPTYTPTPTGTPPPTYKMHGCPKPGKWAMASWEGADDTGTAEALATCEEDVDAVYALDPDTQAWHRYFPERPDISDLLTLKDKQGLFARGRVTPIATPTPTGTPPPTYTPTPTGTPPPTYTPTPTSTPPPTYTPTPTGTPPPTYKMHGCPKPGKWSIAVWEGANGIDMVEALAACGEEVDAVYALDLVTQKWSRYFPTRPDISDLVTLDNMMAVFARGRVTAALECFDPEASVTLSSYDAGDNADVTSTFEIPSGDVNFDAMVLYMPGEWGVATDSSVPDGTEVGSLETVSTVGLLGGACTTALPLTFTLMDATTDTSATVTFGDQFQDADADTLPDGVEKYPDFLTRMFPDISPRARYFAETSVAGSMASLNFVIFEPGALEDIFGGDASWGYPMVIVLNDLGDPMAVPEPGAISDFCTPLETSTTLLGESDSVVLLTNPQYGGDYVFRSWSRGQPDADSDCLENALDTCPYLENSGDPRVSGSGDQDSDGLDSACDPQPNVYDIDEDDDVYSNRQDNCPLVVNGQTVGLNNQADADGDGIGDVCDDHPGTMDGTRPERTIQISVGISGPPP